MIDYLSLRDLRFLRSIENLLYPEEKLVNKNMHGKNFSEIVRNNF